MKLFLYNKARSQKRMNRARSAAQSVKEKKSNRIFCFLQALAVITFFVFSAAFFVGCYYLAIHIIPEIENIFLNILLWVAKIVTLLLGFIMAIFVGVFAILPIVRLSNRFEVYLQKPTLQIRQNACKHLREYYGFCEPFIVTKCLNSTVAGFTEKDVCLFFVDGRLRITSDIYNGFVNAKSDCGCVEFTKDEVTLSKIQFNNLRATNITDGINVFVLSVRAYKFISIGLEINNKKSA